MSQERGKVGSILIGILLIAAGVGIAGNILFDWHLDIFFEGWWTLFIIVPCIVSIIRYGVKMRNLAGLAAGLILFLCARDIIDWWIVGRMLVPVILILIGLQIIVRRNASGDAWSGESGRDKDKESEGGSASFSGAASQAEEYRSQGGGWNAGEGSQSAGKKEFRAIFGQRKVVYQDEIFHGASVESIFGNVELDLRRAVITGEERLTATAMLGTVDIWLPENVNLVLHASPVLGTVSNLRGNSSWMPAEGAVVIDASSTLGTIRIQ